MKTKKIALTLALFLTAGGLFAATSQIGTWKLNEAKSKFSPGQGKNTMVVYRAVGDKVKVTVNGVDATGKATRNVWEGKFDGRDYKVTGDPTSDTRSYKMENANTLVLTTKKGGKVVASGRIVVAADRQSRTVTTSGTDANGKKFENVAVYDRK